MAYDKVVDSSVLDGDLLSIANAIREKAGSSDSFAFPAGFVEAIATISGGGGKLVTGSITLAERVEGKNVTLATLDFTPSIAGIVQAETPTTLNNGEVGCAITVNAIPRAMAFGLVQLSPSIRYYGEFDDNNMQLASHGVRFNDKSGELYYSPVPRVYSLLGTYHFFAIE